MHLSGRVNRGRWSCSLFLPRDTAVCGPLVWSPMEQWWSQGGPVVPREAAEVMGRAGKCSTHRVLGIAREFRGGAVVPSKEQCGHYRRTVFPTLLLPCAKHFSSTLAPIA